MKTMMKIMIGLLLGSASMQAGGLGAMLTADYEKLHVQVAAWNNDCKGTDEYNQQCADERFKLSADLAKFIAAVNDLTAGGTDEYATPVWQPRLKWALHTIEFLGRADAKAVKQ